VIVFAAWLAFPEGVGAKCASVTYEVEVTILQRCTEKPVADAALIFFEPGADSALVVSDREGERAATNDQGTFRGTIRFNTYSGWGLRGDRCRARLERLEVIVLRQGRPAERVHFRNLRATRGHGVFTLEPLTVEVYP
jgi:hypothetical protein